MLWRALLVLTGTALAVTAQDPSYAVEKVMGNYQFATGVAWMRDHLLVSDITAGKINKIDSEGPSLFKEDFYAGGMAADSDGRLYICDPRGHRLVRLDSKKNKQDVLADKFDGKRLNGPTAVVVSKNNHVWFTDSAFGSADREKELSHYGVYHLSPKGELSLVSKMAGRPNGIALSHDQKTLYVVDSDTRSVLSLDVDRSGVAANPHVLFRVNEGVPNGIAAGADGKLYVAARVIEVYDRTGKFDSQIEMSEKPGDLTFGDSDASNLYVAARTSVYRVRFHKDKDKGGKSN